MGAYLLSVSANYIGDVAAGTKVLFISDAGTKIDPTGGATVTAKGTLSGSGLGQVAFGQGTLQAMTGGATFHFPAPIFQWTGGTLTGGWTNTSSLTLAGRRDQAACRHSLHNQYTITQTTDNLQIAGGALLDNQAEGHLQPCFRRFGIAGQLNQLNQYTGNFNNAGMLLKSAGADVNAHKPSIQSVVFTNTAGAQIDVQKGALQMNGDVSNTGTVIIAPASSLVVNGNYSRKQPRRRWIPN